MQQISRNVPSETVSSIAHRYKMLADVDHNIAGYVIKHERATQGDMTVVNLIKERNSDGKTLLFGATLEKATVLLEELMKSGGREEVAELIKACDIDGNTALFGANPETARLLINRLMETVSRPFDVFEFIASTNRFGDTASDNGSPKLLEVIREALGGKILRN